MIRTSLTGETMIFRNDDKSFPTYSTSMGTKNKEGTYDNAYIEVKFKKGVELENKTKINILDGFLTFRQYEKDGKKRTIWYLFVMDFEESEKAIEDNFTQIDEEIPF